MKLQRQNFSAQLFKDPECWLESRTHDLPRHSPVHNQVSGVCMFKGHTIVMSLQDYVQHNVK